MHGGRSRKLRPVLQTGNHVDATWKARLADNLGHFALELRKGFAAQVMDDAAALAALTSIAALTRLLPERDPHPNLYEVTLFVLGFLDESAVWPALVVRWELALLEELGFGLDLASARQRGPQISSTSRPNRAAPVGCGGRATERAAGTALPARWGHRRRDAGGPARRLCPHRPFPRRTRCAPAKCYARRAPACCRILGGFLRSDGPAIVSTDRALMPAIPLSASLHERPAAILAALGLLSGILSATWGQTYDLEALRPVAKLFLLDPGALPIGVFFGVALGLGMAAWAGKAWAGLFVLVTTLYAWSAAVHTAIRLESNTGDDPHLIAASLCAGAVGAGITPGVFSFSSELRRPWRIAVTCAVGAPRACCSSRASARCSTSGCSTSYGNRWWPSASASDCRAEANLPEPASSSCGGNKSAGWPLWDGGWSCDGPLSPPRPSRGASPRGAQACRGAEDDAAAPVVQGAPTRSAEDLLRRLNKPCSRLPATPDPASRQDARGHCPRSTTIEPWEPFTSGELQTLRDRVCPAACWQHAAYPRWNGMVDDSADSCL